MGRTGRPKRAEGALSRERVLAAAQGRVETHGLTGLTMRSLAGDLGVDPMALYHYFPNKAALVGALVAETFGAFRPAIDLAAPWQVQVRAFALAYAELTRAHPHLVLAIAADPAAAATAAALLNPALHAALRTAGLTSDQVTTAAGVLIDYIHGFALGMQHERAAGSLSIEPGLQIIIAGIHAQISVSDFTADRDRHDPL
jgi:AcrR family transcriptional regulator